MKINYAKIPEDTMETIKAYIETGRPMGSFCTAVVSNDLKEAFARADEPNRDAMFEIVSWLYNHAPMGCWGSPENVNEWMLRKQAARMANA